MKLVKETSGLTDAGRPYFAIHFDKYYLAYESLDGTKIDEEEARKIINEEIQEGIKQGRYEITQDMV